MRSMTWQMAKVAAVASVAVAVLGGCDQKPPQATSAQAPQGSAPAEASKGKPSVAKKLDAYAGVRLTEELDQAGLAQFRQTFMKSLAAASDVSDTELVAAAFPEVGAEPDAFKRDDLAKVRAADLAALRKAATPLVRLDSDFVAAHVSPYDMATESYTVVLSQLVGASQGYSWDSNGKGGSNRFGYKYEVDGYTAHPTGPNAVQIVKKVAKDEARQIEAVLAPLRSASSESAKLAVSVYGTVGTKVPPTAWNNAYVTVTPDAYALRLPKQDAPLIFIDGPEIKAKPAPSSGPAVLHGI